jgi:hypothetical protein
MSLLIIIIKNYKMSQAINSHSLLFLLSLQIAWFSPLPSQKIIMNAYPKHSYIDVNMITYYVNLAL